MAEPRINPKGRSNFTLRAEDHAQLRGFVEDQPGTTMTHHLRRAIELYTMLHGLDPAPVPRAFASVFGNRRDETTLARTWLASRPTPAGWIMDRSAIGEINRSGYARHVLHQAFTPAGVPVMLAISPQQLLADMPRRAASVLIRGTAASGGRISLAPTAATLAVAAIDITDADDTTTWDHAFAAAVSQAYHWPVITYNPTGVEQPVPVYDGLTAIEIPHD